MGRKTFKDNPALQFISQAGEAEQEEITQQVTQTQIPKRLGISEEAPEGYKLNPKYIELKTKRLQLVLQPSLLERVRKKAKESGLSVNEYVHRILDKETREE